ncbi:MAG: GtrA family protein [Bacteroidia bacterium]|nr:GtrA family protein [Bacteroidia bacterium]NNJ55149.1 GtrA family protein [Bacteroidia bacterium]
MAIYQASKQLTKFIISGLIAVGVDFIVYFALSQYLDINLSKGLSFCSGMLVTYNLNKYWTWRKTDKDNKRLLLFTALYLIAMVINITANHYAFDILPNSEFISSIRNSSGSLNELITIKIDKVLAFIIATGVSATFTFIGQKYWLFKEKD